MLEMLAAAMIASQNGAAAPAPPRPAAQPSIMAAVPGKTLRELPNVAITYYDVTGKDLKAINASMAQQQARDASGKSAVAPTGWKVDTTFNKSTTGTQCKVVSAKAAFSANVSLPRLVSNPAHTPQLLAAWRNYVAGIENVQAANLWFVKDRMGEVEKAILASSCDNLQSTAAAAVERVKAQAAEFQRVNMAPAATAK